MRRRTHRGRHRIRLFTLPLLLVCFLVWRRKRRSENIAQIFTFHKDEDLLLRDWLAYHASLVGKDNIVVIDHGSRPEVLKELDGYTVVHFSGSFREKAKMLSEEMKKRAHLSTFLIPLDVDEFLIHFEELYTLKDERKYKFGSRVAKCDGAKRKRLALERKFTRRVVNSMSKTFYRSSTFVETDQGNHYGMTTRDNGSHADLQLSPRNFDTFFAKTQRLTLLHFAMRDYDTWLLKLFQRAKVYGFSLDTKCAGIRKGQRYCRSYQNILKDRKSGPQEYRKTCTDISRDSSGHYQQVDDVANFLMSLHR